MKKAYCLTCHDQIVFEDGGLVYWSHPYNDGKDHTIHIEDIS